MNSVTHEHRRFLSQLSIQAMTEHGLRPEISAEARQEVAQMTGPAKADSPELKDLRGLLWCSIDNDDSRDLDQLSCSEIVPSDSGEQVRIWVAIADVDALVRQGSAVDEQACANTTSVYTSAKIFPMLPDRLCYDLTSLNPHQDRLALVCEMLFSSSAELLSAQIYRAWVNNHCQLAYDAVSAWLEGQGPLPAAAQPVPGMVEQLKVQDRVAQQLRLRRHQQGALEFESFQPRAQFENEQITGLDLQPHNRARQLIEELMVATNGCTARFLGTHGGASIRRVVRSPERWQAIVAVAKSHGFDLPHEPNGQALETFLAQQHRLDPLRFPDLSLVIIKLMGSGEYVVERNHLHPVGHFGLAVRDYTHSTAPNRRYPDVITLRMIKAILAHQPSPYSDEALNALALHCTRQEDASRKVERQMRKSEAALLLQHRIGQFFNAVVTGTADKGTWVRVFEPPVEGKLVGHLPPLRVGQKLRVKLVTTQVERGFIDFVLVNSAG